MYGYRRPALCILCGQNVLYTCSIKISAKGGCFGAVCAGLLYFPMKSVFFRVSFEGDFRLYLIWRKAMQMFMVLEGI